jgi:hypothetical protein
MTLIVTLLLVAAFILFLLAAFWRPAKVWFLPLGLACWVLTAILGRQL